MKNKNKILSLLAKVYGDDRAEPLYIKLQDLIDGYRKTIPSEGSFEVSEESSVLITYGDMVRNGKVSPLSVLKGVLDKYLNGVIDKVHILPFYPYSSDDGFSVIDYREVDPNLGSWRDVEAIGESFGLVFDAVINHISAESAWFKKYLDGDDAYKDYFIEVEPEADISQVVRPRSLPLLTPFNTKDEGKKQLWTTFSEDQIDLNYRSESLFLDIIDVLLLYAQKGAILVRLDAIAFLWKEYGTTCIHLEQTHQIIKIIRLIFEEIAPSTGILTETNVPHEENISYFSNNDEAHMVYQFSLPPLTAHGLLRGRADILSEWVGGLDEPSGSNTYFNFLASHDGIGVRPATGILAQEEIDFLVHETESKGGNVSYKDNSDGTKSPYELNINYFSLLNNNNEKDSIARFLLAQSVLLTMPGVCGIYFHSLFGSENYGQGVKETGRFRSINREKVEYLTLEEELENPDHRRYKIFNAYKNMLETRKANSAFHPKSGFKVHKLDKRLFVLQRGAKGGNAVFAIHNFSSEVVNIDLNKLGSPKRDLLTNTQFEKSKIEVKPYQCMWLMD